MLSRGWTTTTAVALALAVPTVALADDFARDLAKAREAVERRRWNGALDAYQELFDTYEGDRRVIAERVGIERDLQLCLFNRGRDKPSGEELFGAAAERFSTTNRKLELAFPRGTRDPMWQGEGTLRLLPIRFDRVEIIAPAAGRKTKLSGEYRYAVNMVAVLAYNPETEGGYRVTVTFPAWEVERLERGGYESLDSAQYAGRGGPAMAWVEVSHKPGEVRIEAENSTKLVARDRTHEAGFVALVCERTDGIVTHWRPGHGDAVPVRIEGRVEKTWLDQRIAEFEHEAFETWKETRYDPAEVLPEWVLDGEIERIESVALVPPHVPASMEGDVRRYLQALATGDDELRFDRTQVELAAKRGQGFLTALFALEAGRLAEAEEALREYVERHAERYPESALWLARVLARRRNLTEARAVLAASADELADDPDYHSLAALLHLIEGDLDQARAALLAARSAEVWTDDLDLLARGLEAALRGPQWKRTFNRKSTHFEVFSDHSADLCGDVAKILQDGMRRMVRTFRPLPEGRLPTRVYVFASRRGYMDFAEELLVDLSFSAGAYIPKRHVMVLWLPEDRREFGRTVRHEGFHLYAHHFAETLPHWLNEGWAEYYGNADDDSVRVHETDRDDLAGAVRRYRVGFDGVEDLLRMPGAEFMEHAARRYVQSWALVTWLAETEDEALKGLLDDYFEALVAGRSQDQAFDEVFGPVAERLEPGFREFLNSL